MKFAISNIAWSPVEDRDMYDFLRDRNLDLEIAPTRIFPWGDSMTLGRMAGPYDHIREANIWAKNLYDEYNIRVVSMQSILNGFNYSLFTSEDDRRMLINYLKKGIDFANAMLCPNMVFGCPLNRNIPDDVELVDAGVIAVDFFTELAMYAANHGTSLGIEANPTIYKTNFLNYTDQVFSFVQTVRSALGRNTGKGIGVNLDLGTIIHNEENIYQILAADNIPLINHVHFSEPNLSMLKRRRLHEIVLRMLEEGGYEGYISIEMRMPENEEYVYNAVDYVRTII